VPLTAAADAVDDYIRSVIAAKKVPASRSSCSATARSCQSGARGSRDARDDLPVRIGRQTVHRRRHPDAGRGRQAGARRPARDTLPDGPPSWHRITIRHLLTHTSGLKDYGSDEIDFRKDYTEDEYLEVIKRMPIEVEPGTQWSYSNTGYLLLGILTSRLAARTGFRYLGEDDLSAQPVDLRGERVERIAYYALDTKDERHAYRFRLTGDGRVVDFDSEER
jgi:hypothetical protein